MVVELSRQRITSLRGCDDPKSDAPAFSRAATRLPCAGAPSRHARTARVATACPRDAGPAPPNIERLEHIEKASACQRRSRRDERRATGGRERAPGLALILCRQGLKGRLK